MDPQKISEIKAGFEKARMEQYYEDARTRLKIVSETGFLFIKSMLILSGGAIVILLALVKPGGGSVVVSNPSALLAAFGLFGFSALLTIVSLYIAHLGQDEFHVAETKTAEHLFDAATSDSVRPWPTKAWDEASKIGKRAVVIAGLAIASFAGGFISSLIALSVKAAT